MRDINYLSQIVFELQVDAGNTDFLTGMADYRRNEDVILSNERIACELLNVK